MPNPVLDRKRAERADQLAFVDELLAKVEADGGRDLVDAELKNLEAARGRVKELDLQITPLEEHEAMRAAHQAEAAAYVPVPTRQAAAPIGQAAQATPWASPGAFVVDHLRANGYMTDPRSGHRLPADPEAMARVRYALQNQTTPDIPGLLPHLIVGQVISLIDAQRPFITSIGGGRAMGGIPGTTFGRPKVTQHTNVGAQSAEKAELPTRKMIIGEVPFTKATYGGALDVSRQSIDWSSPAAWDILIRDLADMYAIVTEGVANAGMWGAADDVNAAVGVATANTVQNWSTALYTAAASVYNTSKRLPDRIWCSVDVWALLGPLTDIQTTFAPVGQSELSSFAGNLFRVPRIVLPGWGTGRCVIGVSSAYEVYEEVIGLLSAVEPSLLGVEVAYGGYLAHAAVFPEGLCRITPFGVTPTETEGAAGNAVSGPDYASETVADLQSELASRGLTTSGTKAELVDRLQADDAARGA